MNNTEPRIARRTVNGQTVYFTTIALISMWGDAPAPFESIDLVEVELQLAGHDMRTGGR